VRRVDRLDTASFTRIVVTELCYFIFRIRPSLSATRAALPSASFIAQTLHRVQLRGAHGGYRSEDRAYGGRDEDGHNRRES